MGCMAGSPFVALRQISLSASSGSPEPWKNVTASGPEMAPEPSVAFVGESAGSGGQMRSDTEEAGRGNVRIDADDGRRRREV